MAEMSSYMSMRPCPFCGGKPFIHCTAECKEPGETIGWKMTIMCEKCGIYAPNEVKVLLRLSDDGEIKTISDGRAELAKYWNGRGENKNG